MGRLRLAAGTNQRLLEAWRLIAEGGNPTILRQMAWTTALVATGALLSGLAPLALKGLIDSLSPASQTSHPAVLSYSLSMAAAYLLLLGGGRLLTEVRPFIAGSAEQGLISGLRKRFFEHLLRLPMAFHMNRKTGATLQGLHQATAACQLLISSLVNSVMPVLVELLTIGIVIAQLSVPGLAGVFAITTVAYFMIHARGAPVLHARTQSVSLASLTMHAQLADGLLNCETIKCFNSEDAITQRLSASSDTLRDRWCAMLRQRSVIGVSAALVFLASLTVSLSLAASAVIEGSLSIGGFVLAQAGMLQVMRPLEMLGAAARDISQSLALIGPFATVMTHQVEQTSTSPTSDGPGYESPPGIRFRGVVFGYRPEDPVLRGLNLDVPRGRSVAIVGASGCGKSSLARLLLRLYSPQQGHIEIDGKPLDDWGTFRIREMIGLVPQDTLLLDDTIAANIALGRPGASMQDIEAAARAAELHAFIESLPEGYRTTVGERGLRLSGGERQRVAIARAVLRRPGIYVFDEATSMLDSDTEDAVLRQLREVSSGCTTITIAHRLSTIRFSDEILVLEDGVIAERGDHATLMHLNGSYARLWRSQSRSSP